MKPDSHGDRQHLDWEDINLRVVIVFGIIMIVLGVWVNLHIYFLR